MLQIFIKGENVMTKDKRYIGIIILLVIVMTALIILICKTISRNKEKTYNMSNNIVDEQENLNLENRFDSQQSSNVFSNEQRNTATNELGTIMDGKTDKCKVIVNGEKITEREIAFAEFQYNNSIVNTNGQKIDTEDRLIKEYLVGQDAKDKGIALTENENKNIEDRIKDQMEVDKNSTKVILRTLNMKYDEFLEFYTKRIKRLEIETKWTLHINEAIRKGELNTKNEAFNKKCKQYRENKTESQNISLLFELVDEYKEYLKEEAKIEYID